MPLRNYSLTHSLCLYVNLIEEFWSAVSILIAQVSVYECSLICTLLTVENNQATGYASQHIWCLSQAMINWEGCDRRASSVKMGYDGGGSLIISLDGVAPSRIVGVSASVIFHCTTKARRRRSRRRFLLWHRLTRVVPEKKAVKWLCVCVLMLRTINTAIKKALRQLITFQSLMKALHSETDTTV